MKKLLVACLLVGLVGMLSVGFSHKEGDFEGELEIFHEDHFVRGAAEHSKGRDSFYLKEGEKRTPLHFKEDPGLLTGDKVRIKGKHDGTILTVESLEVTAALPPPVPYSFGEQRTLAILVNFTDNTSKPYSLSTVQNLIFGQISAAYYEQSYGQTWLTGDTVGWYTLPMSSSPCNARAIATAAQAAATAHGVNLAAYGRYIYVFPRISCPWAGSAFLGGSPSQAWINGNLTPFVVSHEIGHTFGLYHSASLDCGLTTLGPTCTKSEYGDWMDTMGRPRTGHFNAYQKGRLGWLGYGESPPTTYVDTDGLYTLEPLETDTNGVKALVMLKEAPAPGYPYPAWYTIEYRQALGLDKSLGTTATTNVLRGVVIHTNSRVGAIKSYLLDMSPGDPLSDWHKCALEFGKSFHDPVAGITITAVSGNETQAKVQITFTP